jgi:membrane protease YdiL (CAAX protease family)
MAGRAASRAAESSMLANGLVSLAIMALMFAIPFVVFLIAGRRAGLRPADIGLRLRPVWAEVAWGILGYIVIMPAVILVTIAASRIPGAEDSAIHPIVYELGAPGSSAVLALLFILAAVFAPLTEETMFRGVFFNALAPRLGVAWSIVVSSLVFSILHPQLPVGGPAIYLLGVGFSALYAIRGSLVAPMVAHAINNGATLLMLTLVFAG